MSGTPSQSGLALPTTPEAGPLDAEPWLRALAISQAFLYVSVAPF